MEHNNRILHITSWYLLLPDTGTLLCITHTLSFSLSNSDSASVHHYHCLCLCLVSVCVSVSSSVPVPFPIAITVSVSVSITLFLSFTARTPRQPTSDLSSAPDETPEEQLSNPPTVSQPLGRPLASSRVGCYRRQRYHRLAHTFQRQRMQTAKPSSAGPPATARIHRQSGADDDGGGSCGRCCGECDALQGTLAQAAHVSMLARLRLRRRDQR